MSRFRGPTGEVKQVYDGFPAAARKRLLQVRRIILEAARSNPEVGQIEETLKWGEPAYLTPNSKSGTTIRLGWKGKTPERYAMYLNCQTDLVDTYRTIYPEQQYEGNRAVSFAVTEDVPVDQVRHMVEMALTYHLAKKSKKRKAAG